MSELRFEAAGVLGTGLVASLFATTRIERIDAEHYLRFREEGTPVIFAFWHGYLLPLVHYHRHEGIVVLVSEHGDGEYITRVIRKNGFGTVRGSSTRGGIKGLKGLVAAARRGRDLALTPDGPTGPRGEFKPGALAVAQMTGFPLVPLAVGATGHRFASWDRFVLPRPFSKVTIQYCEPRWVARDASREELDALAREVSDELNELERLLNPELEP